MYPREFEYVAPESLEAAVQVLADNPGAKVIAGGLSLLPLMKMRLLSPPLLVDIGRIPGLDQIEEHDDYISVGALVRHAQTATHPLIAEHAQALAEAAAYTGDAQVRNRGTTCGSMAHADIAADSPAAALALGAVMVTQSVDGARGITARDCFIDTLTTSLQDNEIMTELRIPKANAGEASAYDKLGRRGGHSDYAVAGAAAWVAKQNGTISDARVALTGVGTRPIIALGSGETIIGTDGSADAIAAAADRAAEGVTVLEDLYGSEDYKAHLASVYVKHALEEAIARA
jgi:carbon-monoxide dehydrogenase medium subunit